MRWHPPSAAVSRVLVWRFIRVGQGRKAGWTWQVQSRNGRLLVVSKERFSGRLQCLRAAQMFGRPETFENYNRITALHDGAVLVLNWSDPA